MSVRTVSRRHAVLLLLSQSDAAVVAGVAAALAADVGRRVPVMLGGSRRAGGQRVGGKHRSWSRRRRGRSRREECGSRFGHVVRSLLLHNKGRRSASSGLKR